MKLILGFRRDYYGKQIVETYAESYLRAFANTEHELLLVGEGHPIERLEDVDLSKHDLFIDLDCGRNGKGKLSFQVTEDYKERIPTAIILCDSHGYPSLHRRMAKRVSHVFFAVWDKRDLFANHKSAHFLPNASDDMWFDWQNHKDIWYKPEYHVGFFGSRGGLDRADILKSVSKRNAYKVDIREIGRQDKPRWPRTAAAMSNCWILFNHGQKHDLNLRIFESMLINRPYLHDRDPRNGMKLLFEEGEHYLSYGNESELAENIRWILKEPDLARSMAWRSYKLVKEKHLVKHRAKAILEVVNGAN